MNLLSGSALLVWAMESAAKKKVLQGVSTFIPDNSRNLCFQKIFNERKKGAFQPTFHALYSPQNFFEGAFAHFASDQRKAVPYGAFPFLAREELGLIEERFHEWFYPLDKEELFSQIEKAGVGVDLFSLWRKVVLTTALSTPQKKERVAKLIKSLIQSNLKKIKEEKGNKVSGLEGATAFLEKYVLASAKEKWEVLEIVNENWLTDPFPLVWGFYFEEEKRDFTAPFYFKEELSCVLAPRDRIAELKHWLAAGGIHTPLYALEETSA